MNLNYKYEYFARYFEIVVVGADEIERVYFSSFLLNRDLIQQFGLMYNRVNKTFVYGNWVYGKFIFGNYGIENRIEYSVDRIFIVNEGIYDQCLSICNNKTFFTSYCNCICIYIVYISTITTKTAVFL